MKRTKAANNFIDFSLAVISGVFIMHAFAAPTVGGMVLYGALVAAAVIALSINLLCERKENQEK